MKNKVVLNQKEMQFLKSKGIDITESSFTTNHYGLYQNNDKDLINCSIVNPAFSLEDLLRYVPRINKFFNPNGPDYKFSIELTEDGKYQVGYQDNNDWPLKIIDNSLLDATFKVLKQVLMNNYIIK